MSIVGYVLRAPNCLLPRQFGALSTSLCVNPALSPGHSEIERETTTVTSHTIIYRPIHLELRSFYNNVCLFTIILSTVSVRSGRSARASQHTAVTVLSLSGFCIGYMKYIWRQICEAEHADWADQPQRDVF